MLGLITLLISLLVFIFMIIASVKLFQKANIAGWKVIIPIYNTYSVFKGFWQARFFWFYFFATILASFSSYMATASAITNIIGGLEYQVTPMVILFGIICLIFFLVASVLYVVLCYQMSCGFGHKWGYTAGLVFLPIVFIPILAFNSDEFTHKELIEM